MTLVELVDQILAELGFPKSSGVMASQERTVQQISALANRLGRDLTRDYDWRMLMREHILVTEARVMSASVTEGSYVVTVVDTSGLSAAWGVTGEGCARSPRSLVWTLPRKSLSTCLPTSRGPST